MNGIAKQKSDWFQAAVLRTSWKKSWPFLIPSVVLFGLSLTLFPSAGRDDSYMTYWPAFALSNFGKIVNYNGDFIEQSSSLLNVVLLAVLAKLSPLSVPDAGPVLSLLSSVAALIYTQKLAAKFVDRTLSMLAALLVATSAYFAYWTTGGLETTMAAALFAALSFYYVKFLEKSGSPRPGWDIWAATLMFVLVRPETIFVGMSAMVGSLIFVVIGELYTAGNIGENAKPLITKLLRLALVLVVAWVAVSLFRLMYFGDLFPQPVSAKVNGLSGPAVIRGWRYLVDAIASPQLLLVFAAGTGGVVYVAFKRLLGTTRRISALILAMLVTAQLSFLVVAGGDWMEGGRFVVPILPLIAVLGVYVARVSLRRVFVLPVLMAILALQIPGSLAFANSESRSVTLWEVKPESTEGHRWTA